VKEARDEAKKEIEAYRAEKEAKFKKFESEVPTPAPLPIPPLRSGLRH
jgi:hypothetical protein